MVSVPSHPLQAQKNQDPEFAARGWRVVTETKANGKTETVWKPLTSEAFLHPEEGYHLPNNPFHNRIVSHAEDILTRRYRQDPSVGVFRDFLIQWDIEGLKDNCPDVFVVFGPKNKYDTQGKFPVKDEGVRPAFILEVVSPRYRKEDREIKVVQYALAGVSEYVIVDRRQFRGQILEEVLGYRLVEGIYQPITPDEEGRILCETVGVLMSLREDELVIEDASSGKILLSSGELEEHNSELEAAKKSAEERVAEMEALLASYQEQLGELPKDSKNS